MIIAQNWEKRTLRPAIPRVVAKSKEDKFVTAQAEKQSVIKGEMIVGGKWADIRRSSFHVNERLTSA